MTDWQIVACKAPGCHSLAFNLQHDPKAGKAQVVCSACGAAYLTLDTSEAERRQTHSIAPPGTPP